MAGPIDIFTLDAVFIRRQQYWTNGYRPVPKWNPGAVDLNGEPIRNAGKASKGVHWREEALQNPPPLGAAATRFRRIGYRVFVWRSRPDRCRCR